ncbi:spore gernimation protein KB [Salipaludibacillus neizhouensis]|uniref:Spore gernimation protein KB n=1 Tax=Salipaludibacillus neizhouensis TaxID=885475 RepID=A0A3A9KTB5_9BACI|nr:GerAB/ArcD/ProY family transporter [Salipaludibacillus neizhouensis]RKL67866.1 spore gernimation protein KB [Salipaludibacillus neizhouensis]
MEKIKITPFQFFTLIVLLQLGSAIVISPGVAAKQDAWLAILLGLSGGVVLFLIYSYLYHQFPELSLTEYLPKILGKHLGWFIGFLYSLYFLYIGTRVLRDFGDLLVTAIFPETPLFIISLLMVLTIVYVISLGFEVLSRTGEFYLLLLMFIGFVVNFLFLMSGEVELENFLPILGEGWMPVVSAAFPRVLTFPFGEMIVFTMILPYLNNRKAVLKVGLIGLVFSGALIIFATMMNIAVLGIDIVDRATFPLLSAISKIRIGEFLERLDALAVISLIVGMFFKIAIFIYAGVLGTSILFKVDKYQKLLMPICIIVLISSVSIAENISEHLREGLEIVPKYIHMPFQVYIPLLLLVITVIKNKVSGNQKDKSKN